MRILWEGVMFMPGAHRLSSEQRSMAESPTHGSGGAWVVPGWSSSDGLVVPGWSFSDAWVVLL